MALAAETIGELLVRARTERGVTQSRLADRLCAASGQATVTRNEISRWERGERIPSGYWLNWLGVVLEVPTEQLERATAAARIFRQFNRHAPAGWVLVQPGVYQRVAS